MVLGDAALWTSLFQTVDTRLLQRMSHVWPTIQNVLGEQPDEDTITLNLVEALLRDNVVRRICHWLEFQFEPAGYSEEGAAYSKGKIDIAVFLDFERARYLAYECKRLNVRNDGKRSSLATTYVKDGVMRFVSEQYAKRLPIGCMLGYVMDGDMAFARKRVRSAIKAEKINIRLESGPNLTASVHSVERFSTTHNRLATRSRIEIRHALIPFSSGPQS